MPTNVLAKTPPEPAHLRAWRAVERFRQMQSTITGFVRAISGNDMVRVEATGGGPASTRDVVYVSVPIELGDDIQHDRNLCYIRGENLQQHCMACRAGEEINFQIYHESAHILKGSHRKLSRRQIDHMAGVVASTWRPMFPKFAAKTAEAIRKNKYPEDTTIMGVCQDIHKWMGFTFNNMEDLRVDTHMFSVRPGIRMMSEAMTMRLMVEGAVVNDEQRFWRDLPVEQQILVAISFLGFGYSNEYFSDECKEFIDSHPLLTEYAQRAMAANDAMSAWEIAVELLYYLHTLGMYDPPTEEDDEDDSENESDQGEESQPGENESGEGGGGKGEDEGSPNDQPGKGGGRGEDSADGDKSGDGPSDGGEGDPSDDDGEKGGQQGRGDIDPNDSEPGEHESVGSGPPDQASVSEAMARGGWGGPSDQDERDVKAIETALKQAEHFDQPSAEVTSVQFHRYGETNTAKGCSAWSSPYDVYGIDSPKPPESVVGESLMKARRVFSDNTTVRRTRNMRSGRIHSPSLAKRVPFNDDRMFQKKVVPNAKSYTVFIAADVSGSNSSQNRIHRVRQTLGALSGLVSRLGVEFEVLCHTSHIDQGSYFSDSYTLTLDLYPIKELRERWTEDSYERLRHITDSDANLDGHMLEYLRKRCDKALTTNKVILYLTDGAMPAANAKEELRILKKEIKECRRRGYTLLGVGIDTDSPKKHGLETVRVDSMRDVPNVVRALERKLTGG